MYIIKVAYWLGIVADAFWALVLLFPQLFGSFVFNPEFDSNLQERLIMGIGGVLMTGWTLLLIWGVMKPIERRMVILLTAIPVVFGLGIISLIGYLNGNAANLWILIKTIILFLSMIISFILAKQLAKN